MARDFDLLDGRWYADQPFDDWAWMRAHAPAYWDATNETWALTRHADVLAVEKDSTTFSSHRAPRPHGGHLPMMISMDAPEHSRRRKLVSHGFTPRRVRDHEQTISRIPPEGIVDRFEAVDVQHHHRQATLAPVRLQHRLTQAIFQQDAIG